MEVFPLQFVDWFKLIYYFINECVPAFLYILVSFCNKHFTFREEYTNKDMMLEWKKQYCQNGKNANDCV